MAYKYVMQADNVYCIDTKMFGFDHYGSCYLVKGKELALVDTGHPSQREIVRAAIKSYGFSVSDISYIFVTHCEHGDHSGNVTPLLAEAYRAKVYVNKIGAQALLIKEDRKKLESLLPPRLLARFGERQPVPEERIVLVNDGDIFDLGNGTRLRIIFAPGHQPSGIAILEEKNMGLFIDDLVGNYFSDADCSIILTPYGTDLQQNMESLKKLMLIPAKKLFLGHFGISDEPQYVMKRVLESMDKLIAIGAECVAEGKPEEIESRITASKMPEIEKLRESRGDVIYKYAVEELLPHQSAAFAKYYIKNYANNQSTKT